MMTSSNGNNFRVTGHLCGEFTGNRWIPHTKRPVTRSFDLSLICVWIKGWVNNREAGDLRRYRAHYDVTVKCPIKHYPSAWDFWAITLLELNHWRHVTYICANTLGIIGSYNGLSPIRRQAIIWINAGVSFIGPMGTTVSVIPIKMKRLSFTKMKLRKSFTKWRAFCLDLIVLTHWGRVTHICVVKLTIIGSDNGLSPGRRQTIIWTNAEILLIWPLGTNFIEILIGIQTFSFKKMHLKMSSAKLRPFCIGLNVLRVPCLSESSMGVIAVNSHISWQETRKVFFNINKIFVIDIFDFIESNNGVIKSNVIKFVLYKNIIVWFNDIL